MPPAHASHFRRDTLHRRTTGDKSVGSLLPLAIRTVAKAVLQPLGLVLVLLHFSVGFGKLSFQILA